MGGFDEAAAVEVSDIAVADVSGRVLVAVDAVAGLRGNDIADADAGMGSIDSVADGADAARSASLNDVADVVGDGVAIGSANDAVVVPAGGERAFPDDAVAAGDATDIAVAVVAGVMGLIAVAVAERRRGSSVAADDDDTAAAAADDIVADAAWPTLDVIVAAAAAADPCCC